MFVMPIRYPSGRVKESVCHEPQNRVFRQPGTREGTSEGRNGVTVAEPTFCSEISLVSRCSSLSLPHPVLCTHGYSDTPGLV